MIKLSSRESINNAVEDGLVGIGAALMFLVIFLSGVKFFLY